MTGLAFLPATTSFWRDSRAALSSASGRELKSWAEYAIRSSWTWAIAARPFSVSQMRILVDFAANEVTAVEALEERGDGRARDIEAVRERGVAQAFFLIEEVKEAKLGDGQAFTVPEAEPHGVQEGAGGEEGTGEFGDCGAWLAHAVVTISRKPLLGSGNLHNRGKRRH